MRDGKIGEHGGKNAGNQQPKRTLETILNKINSKPSAKQALRRLVQEGCDENVVIALVYEFCRGENAEEAKQVVDSAKNCVQRWTKLAKGLLDDAGQIDFTIRELAEKRVLNLYYPEGDDPATVLRDFAETLKIHCKHLKSGLTLKSGRTGHLVYLCYLVKAATGEEHYPEIALLIAVLKGRTIGAAKEKNKAADAIRKIVARFEKKSKTSAPHLRTEAEDDVVHWKN